MKRKTKSSLTIPFSVGKVDPFLFFTTIALVLFGLVMIYNSSVVIAERDFADKYHYLREQSMWAMLGIVLMISVSFIEYHFWKKLALPMLLVTLVLLIAVFLPGIGVNVLGASRWINFGFFVLQPAELAKLSIIVYLASWFSIKEKKRFMAFLMLMGLVIGLIMLEPDMGTSIILSSTAFILYFLSGAPLKHFALIIPASLTAIFFLIKHSPYRANRFLTFLDPSRDPQGTSYHIMQTLYAFGNGGLTGLGFGKSLQKYAYLPESTTDSIFAIVAEELGFIGGSILICGFLFLIIKAYMIAKSAPDTFGKLLGFGIVSFISMQIIINLSAQVALLPFTGVPLPLISYGGSSLVVTLVSLGILLSISKQRA